MEELKFNIEVNELNVDIVLEGLCHELEAKLTELQKASEGLRNAESIDENAIGKSWFNSAWGDVEIAINLIDKVMAEKLEWMQD
jgi:hypothetical protein